MCRKILIGFITMMWVAITNGQDSYPIPPANANQLFYLQRTSNANTIVCELNYKTDGALDEEDPINVFWLRYQEKGQKEELNYVQRKFAYGIKATLLAKDKYEMHFVSYKKYHMFLKKGNNNKFNVYATINKKEAILHRIFVKIIGGTLWLPKVEYVELKGYDPATGKELLERLKV